jgi:hypothetical protein
MGLKAHFINEHEYEKDYLVCPICGEVVYLMLVHHQVKHKGQQLPTNTPIQCTGKFKNFRAGLINKSKKFSRGKLKKGDYLSAKNNKEIHYRSSWERTAYEILEKAFSVKAYTGEGIRIPYVFQGKKRHYVPDISIEFIDGSRAIVEIKPKSQCPKGFNDDDVKLMNMAKWNAAWDYCNLNNMIFAVWTEKALQAFARMHGGSLNKSMLVDQKDDEE